MRPPTFRKACPHTLHENGKREEGSRWRADKVLAAGDESDEEEEEGGAGDAKEEDGGGGKSGRRTGAKVKERREPRRGSGVQCRALAGELTMRMPRKVMRRTTEGKSKQWWRALVPSLGPNQETPGGCNSVGVHNQGLVQPGQRCRPNLRGGRESNPRLSCEDPQLP